MTRDPLEGVGADGAITTGAAAANLRAPWSEVIAAASAQLTSRLGHDLHGLYVYGSVATGRARVARSDLDLYAVTRRPAVEDARAVARTVSEQFRGVVRGVGITAVLLTRVLADDLEGAAERCFIRHYCVNVAGEDLRPGLPACRPSEELARGFNGDVADVVDRIVARVQRDAGADDGRRLIAYAARKLLMSAATWYSVRAGGWSTDRSEGARLLVAAAPTLAPCVERVQRWTDLDTSDDVAPDPDEAVTAITALRDRLAREYGKSAR